MGAASETWLREIAARQRAKPLPYWIGHARHAVALHEVREPFEPLLWSGVSRKSQTLKQVWFAGAHADVGGGYAPGDGAGTSYSDISLFWMWHQAKEAGLPLRVPPHYAPPPSLEAPHTPALLLFGGLPPRVRPALAELAKAPREGEYLHGSVLERMWQPLENAYEHVDNAMRVAWHDADGAAMRFHYRLRFGDTQLPILTPAKIQAAVRELDAYLKGEHELSTEKLFEYASVALAFKAPQLERYMNPSAYATAPADRIVAAADALNARCLEPEVSTPLQDRNYKRAAVVGLIMLLIR